MLSTIKKVLKRSDSVNGDGKRSITILDVAGYDSLLKVSNTLEEKWYCRLSEDITMTMLI